MPIIPICDTCMEAAYEEGPFMAVGDMDPPDPADDDDLFRYICVEYGAEMPDHICQRVETGEQCDCGCKRHVTPGGGL